MAKKDSQKPRLSDKYKKKADSGRRKLILLGAGGIGAATLAGIGYNAGWFGSSTVPTSSPTTAECVFGQPDLATLPSPEIGGAPAAVYTPATYSANAANALRAANEMIEHYARALKISGSLIHAVRAFGKDFKLADGSLAVDYLCRYRGADRQVAGKRYVFFPRGEEVHDNSFLKTFLEAGVSPDQPIQVLNRSYTLRDLGEHGKALFRFDPNNSNRYDKTYYFEHLPWGLIAFSWLMQPAQATWKNVCGETINLHEVIDRSLARFESECLGVRDTIKQGQGESPQFRKVIKEHSCFGMHALYGYLACLNRGYRENNLEARLRQMMDVNIWRLEVEEKDIENDYRQVTAGQEQSAEALALQKIGLTLNGLVEAFTIQAKVKFYGHFFEALNYAKLHHLFEFTPEQNQKIARAEQRLYEHIVKLRALDMEALRRWQWMYVNNTVIALGHAARAMKLLTPQNPDKPTGAVTASK
jgi:hypothetical protein